MTNLHLHSLTLLLWCFNNKSLQCPRFPSHWKLSRLQHMLSLMEIKSRLTFIINILFTVQVLNTRKFLLFLWESQLLPGANGRKNQLFVLPYLWALSGFWATLLWVSEQLKHPYFTKNTPTEVTRPRIQNVLLFRQVSDAPGAHGSILLLGFHPCVGSVFYLCGSVCAAHHMREEAAG